MHIILEKNKKIGTKEQRHEEQKHNTAGTENSEQHKENKKWGFSNRDKGFLIRNDKGCAKL